MRKMQILRFKEEENARNFAGRCIKMHGIVLGDDGKYWVVLLADMVKLEKEGYEVL